MIQALGEELHKYYLHGQDSRSHDINVDRAEEALATGATTIAVACPFCMTMMSDGVKNKEKEAEVKVKDIAELIAEAQGL